MTEITAPAGFFWDNAVSPDTATDLLTAVEAAESNVNNALISEENAAASATAAASSAMSASGSQTAAFTSESNAATSASTAATSATAAATSATAAASSATSAASSATSATSQATAAASSATSAASSATAAANSATNAATSATAASASATTASNAAATIPGPLVGRALNFIRINASGNAYEVQTPAQAAADLGALNDHGRNKLHNAQFLVNQRGPGAFTSAGMTLDRWGLAITGDSDSVTRVAIDDTGRSQIGDEEAAQCLQNVFTGVNSAGNLSAVYQRIEGVRRLSGKAVTVSFYAKASSGTPKFGISLDQNWGTGGSPTGPVLGAGSSVVLSTTWTRYSVQLSLGSSAGQTLGTNGDDYTQLNLWYSAGSSNAARAGSVGIQSGTIVIWGVQLEVGGVETPLEKTDPQTDLANCQRHFTLSRLVTTGLGTSGNAITALASLPTQMRAAPTAGATTNSATNTGTVTLFTATGAVWAQFTPPVTSGYIYDATINASAEL